MKYILCALFSFCSYTGFCQDPAFIVIDITGNVMLKSQNKKALIGTKVQDKETVIVAGRSSVTLVCKNSGTIQYTVPGTYIVSASESCKPVNDHEFARLCIFMVGQLFGSRSGESWRDKIDQVAAASREICYTSIDQNLADINYYNGDFNVAFRPITPGSKLFLKIAADARAVPDIEIPLDKNQFSLAKVKNALKDNGDYYWYIATKDDQCLERHQLHITTKQYHDSVVFSLTNTINRYISNKAQQQYLLGIALENKHFFADALQCYLKAMKIDPKETRYVDEVDAFKTRYGMQ